MARRLTSVLEEHQTAGQYCSVPGKFILEAVSVIRDAVTHAQITRTPVCILPLDFRNAFDRISHHYLFQILAGYGLSAWFIDRIRSIYEHATTSIQINGALAGPIPIQSAVRQGCPLSMALYALCLHPLLRTLEDRLTGINIGTRGQKISVLSYADDIRVFLTRREEIETVNQATRTYERETGAQLNRNKSRAFVVGGWAIPITPLGIALLPYISPTHTNVPQHKLRSRIYGVIRTIHSNAEGSDEMRIGRKYPHANWKLLWTNLQAAGISDAQKSTCFTVIHDLTPTKERLAAIHLSETNRCNTCGDDDTMQHCLTQCGADGTMQNRLTQCGASKLIWNWTRQRIAAITITNPLDVPEEWALRPDFHIRSLQRNKAVVWLLAHLVAYHIQGQRRMSLLDYMDFMRQARWKADSRPIGYTVVGSHLTVQSIPASPAGITFARGAP